MGGSIVISKSDQRATGLFQLMGGYSTSVGCDELTEDRQTMDVKSQDFCLYSALT